MYILQKRLCPPLVATPDLQVTIKGSEGGFTTTVDSTIAQTLPELWATLAKRFPASQALVDPHTAPAHNYTFSDVDAAVKSFASGLDSLGLKKGESVAFFSENSSRWLIADQGVMTCGAMTAVRGANASVEELRYILQHSNSRALIVQDYVTLERLAPVLSNVPIAFVIVLWGDPVTAGMRSGVVPHLPPVFSFDQVLERGSTTRSSFQRPELSSTDICTLVYTSGTSGQPKAAALSHANILYQVNQFPYFLTIKPNEKALSLLPIWHIYERTCGYYILSRGASLIYSRIPKLKDDLAGYAPHHFVCVPLVLQTLHGRILSTLKSPDTSPLRRAMANTLLSAAVAAVKAQRIVDGRDLRFAVQASPWTTLLMAWLTTKLLAPLKFLFNVLVAKKIRAALGVQRTAISGGGSLPPHLDDFYEALGLTVLNGWGLTETSPVLACRRTVLNVRGSVGFPIPGTELRIVSPEDPHTIVPDGEQGLILARGPGVFQGGYHNDPESTENAYPLGKSGGWFDTGDLGWRAPQGTSMAGCIVLAGRSKDTIILSSGENVEPQPLEDVLSAALGPLVRQTILVGSGHRVLGALFFVDHEMVAELGDGLGKFISRKLTTALEGRPRWERVHSFKVMEGALSWEDGTLTQTMKPRRAAILTKYQRAVEELEKKLR